MKDFSQNGEQAVILETFEALGIERGHLVDMGAGDGVTMSNSRALLEMGWTGALYDGDPKGNNSVNKAWIDAEWVKAHLPQPSNFLTLDLDGNDHWILSLLFEEWGRVAYPTPDLIVCEINPIFERNEAMVMPYNEAHVWNNDTYYGMSLAACEKLAAQYGYTLMHLHAGINAFLLRNDMAEVHPELIRPIEYKVKHDHKRHDPKLPWITLS